MSDVVNASSRDEQYNGLENSSTSKEDQERDIIHLLELMRLEHSRYIENRIVYETLEEYINSDDGTQDYLKSKVKDIMLSENLSQCLSLDENPTENYADKILGIGEINGASLSYAESDALQKILKYNLDRKYEQIKADLTQISTDKIYLPSNTPHSKILESDDKVTIEFRNNLMEEQEEYINNLSSLIDLLQEIKHFRLNKLPQTTELKAKHLQLEEKINSLKRQGHHQKSRVDVFKETRCSLQAYKELISDIKHQQLDCLREIEQLEELKQKYKNVSCKQYHEILQSYLLFKSAVDKKKRIYRCLNN